MIFQRMNVDIPYFNLKGKSYEFHAIVFGQIVIFVCVCVCVCGGGGWGCVRVLYAMNLENTFKGCVSA